MNDLQYRCQSDRNGPSFAEVLEYVASLNRRSVRRKKSTEEWEDALCISSVVSSDRYGRLQESIVCFCLNIVTIPPIKKTLGGYTFAVSDAAATIFQDVRIPVSVPSFATAPRNV